MRIAVVGKGGAGKTTISALLVKVLSENGSVLAIDADPVGGLTFSLGIRVERTLEDVRKEIAEMIRQKYDKTEIVSSIDYKILESMVEGDGFAFLAMGRPEEEGCYCQLNSMLREAIEILSKSFKYIVIDGEAGVEQINRRVMREVEVLLVVTDTTKKGFQVAQQIREVAKNAVNSKKCALIINKAKERLKFDSKNFDYVFIVPEDEKILEFDVEGKSIFLLTNSKALMAVKNIVEKLDIGFA
ncbi:MAG: AAA family ATPase [Archaeoglobaceae archaeon]|nr:AAA family ATPase [Archaeoglobaceae archaeon]